MSFGSQKSNATAEGSGTTSARLSCGTVEASTVVKELESLMNVYRDLNPPSSSQLETDMQCLLEATETNEASLSVAELMSLFEATVADAGLKEYFDAPSQPYADLQRLMDVFSPDTRQTTPGSSSAGSIPQFLPNDINIASLLDDGLLARGLPVAQGQVQDRLSSTSRTGAVPDRDHCPPQSPQEATPMEILEHFLAGEQEKTRKPHKPIPAASTASDVLSELAGIQQELAHFRANFREIIKTELGVVLQEDTKNAKKNAGPVEAKGHKGVEREWRMMDRKFEVDEGRMEVVPVRQANKRVRCADSDSDELIPHSGRSSNLEVEAAEARAQKRRRVVAPSFDLSFPVLSTKGKGSTVRKPLSQAPEASSSKAASPDAGASASSSSAAPPMNIGPAFHPGRCRREMG